MNNFVSNPANDIAAALLISCVIPGGQPVCATALKMVLISGAKAGAYTLADKMIDRMSWSAADKSKAKLFVRASGSIISVLAGDPNGMLYDLSAFGSAYTVLSASGILSKNSAGQVTGIKIGATTQSGGPQNSALVIGGW